MDQNDAKFSKTTQSDLSLNPPKFSISDICIYVYNGCPKTDFLTFQSLETLIYKLIIKKKTLCHDIPGPNEKIYMFRFI